jgi:FdhD protein
MVDKQARELVFQTKPMTDRKETPTAPPGTVHVDYQVYRRGRWSTASGSVIQESTVCIFVNGRELVTMMATMQEQEELAAGFLFTEGIVTRREDILGISLAPNRTCVDVWLTKSELDLPQRRILTSGCGKGMTFDQSSDLTPLNSDLILSHGELALLMRELQSRAILYHQARGVHAAGLASRSGLVMLTEDVGRHNTLDKLAGRCLLEGVNPKDHILLTTGRVSSEMMNKARRMEIPLVASRTSPTSLSIRRAEEWKITLVGYLRPQQMRVYAYPERLRTEEMNEVALGRRAGAPKGEQDED